MPAHKEKLNVRKEVLFTNTDESDIEHAATLMGLKSSALIRNAAIEKAREILRSEQTTNLTSDNWQEFVNTVTTYTSPTDKMQKNMNNFLADFDGNI